MKKINKIDYIYISLLILFITGFILYLRYKGFLFGSNMDWISQHVTIPEYFRLLFYESKEFIPQFSINLGLGQNIFNFTYYGLLSPYILISYLLPFIKMIDYIQKITILSVMASVILMYRWIYDKYDSKVALLSTIIFMLSGPLLFHGHRHIMFVNYLPFLIGSLILIDMYFIKKKRILFIISIFLLIMSSFYFSFPSIIVIGIYTIYKILQDKKKLNIKNFKPLGKIIFYVIIGILLSGIITIPTIYALYIGRSDTSVSINLLNLFIPELNYKLTFYYSYSLGLTFIYMVALIYSFINKKRENIFLSIILLLCMLIPGISYTLNCFMYIDGKCFIPFLPLAIIVISYFLNHLFKDEINLKKLFYYLIPVIVIMLYSAINYDLTPLLIVDIILIMLFLMIINKTKKSNLIFIPIILISLASFTRLNLADNYVTIEDSKLVNDNSYQKLFNYINKDEMYRTSIDSLLLNQVNKVYTTNQYSSSIYSSSSNQNYLKFVRDNFLNEIINKDYATITQSSNVLFNIYNGSKYLITDKEPLIGYKEIA
ncbi:MAG: YfhO family protein, partial [Bacilli bacterium]|nr:YfhO family protein [Bacilli bacterium]